MADLRHLLAIYVHAHRAGNAVPPHIDADARAALAAEPAFAASEPSDEDLADLSEVFNGDPLPAMRRALELWGRPTISALAAEPPAPAPAADGEREELAQWLERIGDDYDDLYRLPSALIRPKLARAAALLRRADRTTMRLHRLQQENRRFREPERTILCDLLANGTLLPDPDGQRYGVPSSSPADGEREELAQWLDGEARSCAAQFHDRIARAAALLRQPAPAPVPVAERPWERPGWCDAEGRCWWGRCADEVFNPEWALAPHADIKEFCSDAMPQHCLPHWAIPQPPQGGEVEE